MSEFIPLPKYQYRTTGAKVMALQAGKLVFSPKGYTVYPVKQQHAPFDVAIWWAEAMQLREGDYIIWEEGEPTIALKPDEFEHRFEEVSDGIQNQALSKGKAVVKARRM